MAEAVCGLYAAARKRRLLNESLNQWAVVNSIQQPVLKLLKVIGNVLADVCRMIYSEADLCLLSRVCRL